VQLASITAVVVAAKRGLAGPALTVIDQAVQGAWVRLQLAGGVDGETYLVTVRATSIDGEALEQDGEIEVVDLTFTVPDGISSYASIADYVDRFGVEETVRLTDERRAGVIDKVRLLRALKDAAALADAYLAARYAIPVVPIPPLLSQLVCDLARRRLHSVAATEEVVKAFELALKMLSDIGKGFAGLPNAPEIGGTQGAVSGSNSLMFDAPDRQFTTDSLMSF
jgi:phage gp36-like protein